MYIVIVDGIQYTELIKKYIERRLLQYSDRRLLRIVQRRGSNLLDLNGFEWTTYLN